MSEIRITIYGTPVPQGSKSVSKAGHMYDACKGLKSWRKIVTEAAQSQYTGETITAPVHVCMVFTMPQPQHMPKDRHWPSVKPDGSKLQRAVEDSLVDAGVLKDDALIVSAYWAKTYPGKADALAEPGVQILIWVLDGKLTDTDSLQLMTRRH